MIDWIPFFKVIKQIRAPRNRGALILYLYLIWIPNKMRMEPQVYAGLVGSGGAGGAGFINPCANVLGIKPINSSRVQRPCL